MDRKKYEKTTSIEAYIYYMFEEENIAEELRKGNIEALFNFVSFIQTAFNEAIDSLKSEILKDRTNEEVILRSISEFDENVEKISLRMIKTVKSYLELLHDKDMMNFYGNLVF